MSDQDTQQATGAPEGDQPASAENAAADSQSEKQTDSQGQAGQGESTEGSKAEGSDKGKPESDSAGSGEKEQSQKQDSQDAKPKSRRSAQYRIEQLARENAELRKKAGMPPRNDDEDAGDDQNDDKSKQSDEVSSRLSKTEKAVDLALNHAQKSADDAEISEFFSGDLASERKTYEPRIREMWKQDQYKDLSAADLYAIATHAAVTDRIAKARLEAVEEYKKAQKEADESSTGGNTSSANRTGKGKPVDQMTDDELVAHNERVKAGQA